MRKFLEFLLFAFIGLALFSPIPFIYWYRELRVPTNQFLDCIEDESGWMVIDANNKNGNLNLAVYPNPTIRTGNLYYSLRICDEKYHQDLKYIAIHWFYFMQFQDVHGKTFISGFIDNTFAFPMEIIRQLPKDGTADFIMAGITSGDIYYKGYNYQQIVYRPINAYHLEDAIHLYNVSRITPTAIPTP